MTEEKIAELEECFLSGMSDREAVLKCDIALATLYNFCNDNKDFAERKELLKEQVKMRARQNIVQAINAGDKLLSQWYLERKAKDEFSPKSEVESTGSVTVVIKSYKDGDSPSA